MPFRFSLRTLLLLLSVMSIWLGFTVRSARHQQKVLAAIRDYGGYAYYDYQVDGDGEYVPTATPWEPEWLLNVVGNDFFHSIVKVDLVYGPGVTGRLDVDRDNEEILQIVVELPRLEWLSVSGIQATNDGIQHVAGVHTLRGLYVWDTASIIDEAVAKLSSLPRLEALHIESSNLTDRSLRYLASCRTIKDLYLHRNHFTDQGLSYLSDLSSLRTLWLHEGSTNLTDVGLSHLAGLRNLEWLTVQGDGITDGGLASIERLQKLHTLGVYSDSVTTDAFSRLRTNFGRSQCTLFHRASSPKGTDKWSVVQ